MTVRSTVEVFYILIEFCLLVLSVIERGVKIYNLRSRIFLFVFVRVCFRYFEALFISYITVFRVMTSRQIDPRFIM